MSPAGFFTDGAGRLRLVWRLPIYIAGFFFLNIAVSIVVAIVVILIWMTAGPGKGLHNLDALMAELPGLTWVLAAAGAIPTAAITYGWTWVCRRFIDKRDLASLGLRQPSWGWIASLGLGLVAGMLPIALCVAVLQGLHQIEGIEVTGLMMQGLIMVPTFILMAFVEEITCRGYMMQNFIDIRRPILGTVLVSVIFWLIHSGNPHVWSSPIIAANLFLAGVMLTMAYLVSGELWFPTAAHFGWNFCQGVVFGIPVSGIELEGWLRVKYVAESQTHLTGGKFGLEGSVVAVGMLLLEIILFGIILVIRGSPVRPNDPLLQPTKPTSKPMEPAEELFIEEKE